jgi:ABC-type multidrug transport system permease subunit
MELKGLLWCSKEPFTGLIMSLMNPVHTTPSLMAFTYVGGYNMYLTDLINALSGNSYINTVQQATIYEAVFSMPSAPGLCNQFLSNSSGNTLPRKR